MGNTSVVENIIVVDFLDNLVAICPAIIERLPPKISSRIGRDYPQPRDVPKSESPLTPD